MLSKAPRIEDPNLNEWHEEVKYEVNKKPFVTSTAAPGVTDDKDAAAYVGLIWIDTALGNVYICVDDTVGSASWPQLN